MTETAYWRVFCETGEPFCYLLYKSALKDKKQKSDFPSQNTLAFSGTGERPKVRF